MVDPIWRREAEFVAPYYQRHKYHGTITNHFVYPLTRALYGLCVRQPIGGDFGFSGRLAAFYARQDVWQTDVAHYGIDVWMSTTAINEGFEVVQADLGVKRHNPKDPSADLGPMFCQVISTLFYLMGQYEGNWRKVSQSRPVKLCRGVLSNEPPDPLTVNPEKLRDEFTEGFGQFAPLYQQILGVQNYVRLLHCVRTAGQNDTREFSAELWAKVVYDFAYTYQTWRRNRRRLVDLLVPLYFGRTASYCEEVAEMSDAEADAVIENQAAVFESLKPYLIEKFKMWEK